MKSILLFALALGLRAQVPLSIDCGGPGVYPSIADRSFTGGSVWAPGTPGYDPSLGMGVYSTLRYGTAFSYDIPEAPGLYRVLMGFVEPNKTAAKQRVFTVTVNGASTGPLDLFALAGAKQVYQRELLVLASDGHIRISLNAALGNAVISSIIILPPPNGPMVTREAVPIPVDTPADLLSIAVTLKYNPAPCFPFIAFFHSSQTGMGGPTAYGGGDCTGDQPTKHIGVTLPTYRPFTSQDWLEVIYWTADPIQ